MKETKLWIVGKWIDGHTPWELQGVFDDQDIAVEQCVGENWFVGPITLNKLLDSGYIDPVGCWYPKHNQTTEQIQEITMKDFAEAMVSAYPDTNFPIFKKQSWLGALLFGKRDIMRGSE